MTEPCTARELANRHAAIITTLAVLALTFVGTTLSSLRPFWTDEVLQLAGTYNLTGLALLRFVRIMPGQAPLTYVMQHWTLEWLGLSLVSARLPSVLCAVAAIFVMRALSRRLVPGSTLAVLGIWLALPLITRYGTEARPYAEAVLCSALATLFFWKLNVSPSLTKCVLYGLCMLAGLYSIPFTFFVGLGHLAYLLFMHKPYRRLVLSLVPLLCAAALFAPWALWAQGAWERAVDINHLAFQLSPRFPLMLIQELSGGGYACSLPLIGLAVAGCRSLSSEIKTFLLAGILVPIAGAIAADSVFHYYFAIRQVIIVLIPITLLAGEGVMVLCRSKSTYRLILAAVLSTVFVVSCIVKDVRYFSNRSEDWTAGAQALSSATARGYCLALPEGTNMSLYALFSPELRSRICGDWPRAPKILYPVSILTPPQDSVLMTKRIVENGFHEEERTAAGGTTLLFFVKN